MFEWGRMVSLLIYNANVIETHFGSEVIMKDKDNGCLW
jgi:hypothetical protein